MTARDAVEGFHLQFVRLLFGGRDRGSYVVKGGCNLRFFFGSVRYSEDLDLDVRGGTVDAVRDRVESILGSTTLREALLASGIEDLRFSAPKQPTTTQRWKVQLRPRDRDLAVPTKIELSRRGDDGPVAFDAVGARLLARHRSMPVLANHYLLPAAIRQKLGALVHRREAQARDVFDLSLLFAAAGGRVGDLGAAGADVGAAVERAWSLSYDDYRGQVVAFLEPEHADAYGSREAWDAMQLDVVTRLEGLRSRP